MNFKIKFGFSTLLVLFFSLNCALAQQAKQAPEKIAAPVTSTEYEELKKDWDEFQAKAEIRSNRVNQKPALETAYNELIERVEFICEGIQPEEKSPKKAVATQLTTPVKPKKDQVSAMK
jgi:hypothetical protein